jgi:hypothetical protein
MSFSVVFSSACLEAESKIPPHGVCLVAERDVFAFEFVECHGIAV